jgi:hypothetical protein
MTMTSSSSHARALEDDRSTAKWLLASLTAAGLVSIAGVGLERLPDIDADDDTLRLALAVLALASAAAVIAGLILETSAILTARWVTLAALSDQRFTELYEGGSKSEAKEILDALDDMKVELYTHVAETVPGLHRQLATSHDRLAALVADPDSDTQQVEHAALLVSTVDEAAQATVTYANYWVAHHQLARLRPKLVLGAGAVLALAGTYVYLTAPPEPATPDKVEIVNLDELDP